MCTQERVRRVGRRGTSGFVYMLQTLIRFWRPCMCTVCVWPPPGCQRERSRHIQQAAQIIKLLLRSEAVHRGACPSRWERRGTNGFVGHGSDPNKRLGIWAACCVWRSAPFLAPPADRFKARFANLLIIFSSKTTHKSMQAPHQSLR